MGVKGFPTETWLFLEISVEFLIFFDYFFKIILRLVSRATWDSLWILHEQKALQIYNIILNILGVFPFSFVIVVVFLEPERGSILIALLRVLKLIRLKQIFAYFENFSIIHRRKSSSFLKMYIVVFYFILATHMIGCIWLLVARIDPNQEYQWTDVDNFD
jgi:hypothetical protein